MCGIAGAILKSDNDSIHEGSLSQVLNHRGPDAQQYYTYDKAHFWHFRLSIIDTSSAGAQPYTFENLVLTYNGEIYNYQEVKSQLELKGYQFQSNSDTEVVIKAFHLWREKAVDSMRGMFAFSIYDKDTQETFLFRDRVGVKPLYFSENEKGFYFGSEIKVFYKFPIKRTIDINSVGDYFRFGYSRSNNSIWNEIKKIPPGHYLHYKDKITIRPYWQLKDNVKKDNERSEQEWIDKLEEEMITSFQYRMVSDVPVGVFLSGGIDSSLVASVLHKHYGQIHTFTIGFHEQKFNEAIYAAKVAKHLKTEHTEQYLTIESVKNQLFNFYDI